MDARDIRPRRRAQNATVPAAPHVALLFPRSGTGLRGKKVGFHLPSPVPRHQTDLPLLPRRTARTVRFLDDPVETTAAAIARRERAPVGRGGLKGILKKPRKRVELVEEVDERERRDDKDWMREPHFSRSVFEMAKLLGEGERPQRRPKVPRPTKSSVIKAFDRSVRAELKHRMLNAEDVIDVTGCTELVDRRQAQGSLGMAIRSSLSLDMARHVQLVRDVELHEAVDNLIKAEVLCRYHAAFKAAKEAAETAPPERAEEAAATRAKQFTVEFVDTIRQRFVSEQPVQLLGFIGCTRVD